MAREPRIQESSLHYHVIARCNNGAFHFESDDDFEIYLDLIRLFKKKHEFKLFNYELMNSHVHLFLQPSSTVTLAKTIHAIHWRFANDYNKRKKRKGHFWMGRYKNIPVETDEHALTLMRYINRNPIRAGVVSEPGIWKYSGYRFYAYGDSNDLLDPHPTYLGLSENVMVRRDYYKRFVCSLMPGEDVRDSRFSNSCYIGSTEFGLKLGFQKMFSQRISF